MIRWTYGCPCRWCTFLSDLNYWMRGYRPWGTWSRRRREAVRRE